MDGFLNGFPLHYDGPRLATESKNLKSILNLSNIVEHKINKEIIAERVAGPFESRPLFHLRVSPIGLVPKKTKGEFRLIHHLSYPKGTSVNDFIDSSVSSVHYTSFDEAVHMIQAMGRGCYLFKVDLKHAFCLLPVKHGDFDQLGFKFNGQYFIDKALPFGCSISCSTFEKLQLSWNFVLNRKCCLED